MLAGIIKTPELAFTEDESKRMATGMCNVARHYNVQMAEKTMDWVNLLMCCGMIYGGKFAAVNMRQKTQRAHARDIRQQEEMQRAETGIDLTSVNSNIPGAGAGQAFGIPGVPIIGAGVHDDAGI